MSEPDEHETDTQLDELESDLDSVEAALESLDSDDLEQAETIVESLAKE